MQNIINRQSETEMTGKLEEELKFAKLQASRGEDTERMVISKALFHALQQSKDKQYLKEGK